MNILFGLRRKAEALNQLLLHPRRHAAYVLARVERHEVGNQVVSVRVQDDGYALIRVKSLASLPPIEPVNVIKNLAPANVASEEGLAYAVKPGKADARNATL